jgi:methyl-accepting chemotaxis protein
MSSFPISISFQISNPPTGAFDALANSAASLDKAMMGTAGNFDKFSSSVSQIESPLSGVSGSMSQLEGSMSGLEGSIGSAAGSMGEFAGSTEQLNGSISETGGFITDASSSMGDLSTSTGETGTAMTGLSTTTGEFNTAISETGGFVTETGTSMTEMGTAATEGGTAMTELNTATTETNTALTDSVDALGNVIPGLQDTATGASDSAQGFSDLAPPIEDSNAALDTSSGLLEGVSPLLGSTGENAATAATSSEDFSGALGGLNTELGPVNGGLTDSNTLVGTFGDEAATSAGKTDSLKDSASTLAFGLTTLVSTGYGVVNSFLALRDANTRLDRAQLLVEKSASAADKALLGLNKAWEKLKSSAEGPIKGQEAYNTALATFNRLVASGVKSGPEFTKALNDLKVAADGLEGSTVKDNNAIAALNIQTDVMGQKFQKASLDANKMQKAQEGVYSAMVSIGTGAAGVIGSLGSMVQIVEKGGVSAKMLGGALSGVLAPLAAIAVPVGIVVAAFVALESILLAVRQRMEVFDEMGAAIGKAFPAAKDALEDFRQAFINMTDGINTGIGVLLQAVDAASGGATNLSGDWAKLTGTLDKGNGTIGSAGTAFGQLNHIMHATGEQINIGKGKWEDMNGTLVAFGGKVKVAAGGWHELRDGTAVYSKELLMATDATGGIIDPLNEATSATDAYGATAQGTGVILREQTANYSELTTAQKLNSANLNTVIEGLADERLERWNAIKAAENYLIAHGTTAKAVGLSGDVLIGYVASLQNEPPAYSKSVQAASEYLSTKHKEIDLRGKSEEWIIKEAARLQELDKQQGKVTDTTSKHTKELDNLNKTLADNTAELAYYADANNMANRMQLEFNLGVQDAELKLNNQTFALARTNGELEGNIALLEQGKLQALAYGQGISEVVKKAIEMILALEKSRAAFDATNTLMQNGGLQSLYFATGQQQIKTEVQQTTLELANLAGQVNAYSEGTVTAQANNNALVRGFLEQRKATLELSQGFAEAAGKLAALRIELSNASNAIVRFNTGVLEGKIQALEWQTGIAGAKGEAIGFRSEVQKAGTGVGLSMKEMASTSTEQIQNIVEAFNGVPSAMDDVISALDSMGQKIVSSLTKAGEEGKVNFMENIDKLEEELHTTFSEPVKQELLLIAKTEQAKQSIQSDIEVLATLLRNKPLEVAIKSEAAQAQIQQLRDKVAALDPTTRASLGPLQAGLDGIAAWTPGQGLPTLVGHLAEVVAGSENLQGGMSGAISSFQSMYDAAAQTDEGLQALKTSFEGMGLSFDTTTGIIKDKSGQIVGDLQVMGEGATGAVTTATTAIDTLGPAGTAARTTLGYEMVALTFLMDQWAQETKQSAIEISTAFANIAANSGTSLMTIANTIGGLAKILNTFASAFMSAFARDVVTHFATAGRASSTFATLLNSGLSTAAQQLAKFGDQFLPAFSRSVQTSMTQAGSYAKSFASSFSSAMSTLISSANKAISSVRALQSAINSLKSKTITTTHVIKTVRQTVYAAAGGSTIIDNPTRIGNMMAAEFGQKELVTVTPLQGPGRQPIGLGKAMEEAATKKARRLLGEEGERKETSRRRASSMAPRTVLLEPTIITIDGREITRVVNRRMFEESDALV